MFTAKMLKFGMLAAFHDLSYKTLPNNSKHLLPDEAKFQWQVDRSFHRTSKTVHVSHSFQPIISIQRKGGTNL